MRLARKGQHMRNFETRYLHKDGRVVPLAWSGVWSEPEQRHFFFGRDMTERNIAEERLRRLALVDQLTELPNRTSLHEDLKAILDRPEGPASLRPRLARSGRFKDINDTLGHPTGDKILQAVARRLQSSVERNDVYRLGGDESS